MPAVRVEARPENAAHLLVMMRESSAAFLTGLGFPATAALDAGHFDLQVSRVFRPSRPVFRLFWHLKMIFAASATRYRHRI